MATEVLQDKPCVKATRLHPENLVALPSSAMGAANVKPCGININEHFPYTVPVQAVIKDFRTLAEKGREVVLCPVLSLNLGLSS